MVNIPVVIQAGGRGIRMGEVTEIIPKPLVPVGEITMIEKVIEQFDNADITIIVNYLGKLIKAYLDDKDYKFVTEKVYGGTAGSLRLLEMKEDFVLSNCDILVGIDYSKALQRHKDRKADMTIVATRHIQEYPYGTFDYSTDNQLISITEKPKYTHVINTGFYIINPSIFEYIDEYMDMDKLMQRLKDKNKKVYLEHIHNDKYVDMGTLKRYKEFIGGYK